MLPGGHRKKNPSYNASYAMSTFILGSGVPNTMQVELDRQRNLTLKSRTSARVEPLGRSSLRSKGSSNSSNQDKVKVFKNCLSISRKYPDAAVEEC